MPAPISDDDDLVGRAAERARVEALLAGERPAALLLTGPAGIGKTAVWEWAQWRAAADGRRVLRTRCVASEAALPWVNAGDLLARCLDEVRPGLAEPLRDAVDVVLLRQRAGTAPPDERAVGTALLAAFDTLAAGGGLLLAVDDIGYLDPASAKALGFALRRLDADVAVVATVREGTTDPLDGLDRVSRVEVGPLSTAALFHLIRGRLDVTFGRPMLGRISDTSGGNPLYALEIARALSGREISPSPGEPLGLPDSLRSLVADRIRHVDAAVREVVALTATATRPPAAGLDPAVLAATVREGLVEVDDGTVRAAHPLVAAAAYGGLSESERTALHDALAGRSTDPIEHARHLALAVTEPRADVAAALDEATRTAVDRGAVDAAAELAGLAVERTPPGADDERTRRRAVLADALLRCGDTQQAIIVQREVVAASRPGNARASQLIRLGELTVEAVGWSEAVPIVEAAIAEPGIEPLVAAEAHLTIAAVDYDDLRGAYDHAVRAVAQLESLADPDLTVLSGALSQAASAGFRAGHGLDHERFARAIELERAYPGKRRLSDRADASYAALLKYADELDLAEDRLGALLAEAEASGDVSSIAYVRSHLPQLALYRGDLAAARRHAEVHLALAESAGLAMHMGAARFLTGLVAAYDGRVDLAREVLGVEVSGAPDDDGKWGRQRAHGAYGLLAWSQGQTEEAVLHLDRWHALVTAIGLGEPGYTRHHLDYAEVLVTVGRLDDAERFLAGLAERAEHLDRGYARAAAATGRALLASARGDNDTAAAEVAAALDLHASLPLRFDRARTLLAAGRIHRRARAKLAARDLLSEAEGEFTAMGSAPWAAQAADALARVNIRPPSPAELTATERRVAELAARGLTNKQIGAAAFMAPKTVEANLGRAYRKLGITSRAELGVALGAGPPE